MINLAQSDQDSNNRQQQCLFLLKAHGLKDDSDLSALIVITFKDTEQLEEISYVVGAKHMHAAMATEINKLVIGDSDRDHDVKGEQ